MYEYAYVYDYCVRVRYVFLRAWYACVFDSRLNRAAHCISGARCHT
jgi:hypothetical protein